MFAANRRTFKELVDEVLQWTGDEDDMGQMRTLVENAIRASHEKRLVNDRYSFMLYPKPIRFSTVASQQQYSLHEAFLSPLFLRNVTTGDPVKTVPFEQQHDYLPSGTSALASTDFAVLHGLAKVQNQPSEAGTITPTSSDSGDNGNTVIVVGEDADGQMVEETLTLPNAGTVEFAQVLDVVKMGATADWAGTLTLTHEDGTVLVTLGASSFGRQFRQLRFLGVPQPGQSIEYQFFRQPKPLRYDNDIPDIPYPFDRLLVLDAQIATAGFSRPTAQELKQWKDDVLDLEQSMQAQYQDGLAADSVAHYQHYIPR
jgi:hypothetical protein